MEVREFLESLGMDLKKPIAQDIYDGQGIILGEYERFLGCYGLYSNYYAKMISAYISQISGTIDECDFRIYR